MFTLAVLTVDGYHGVIQFQPKRREVKQLSDGHSDPGGRLVPAAYCGQERQSHTMKIIIIGEINLTKIWEIPKKTVIEKNVGRNFCDACMQLIIPNSWNKVCDIQVKYSVVWDVWNVNYIRKSGYSIDPGHLLAKHAFECVACNKFEKK